ncbi:MAG: efflux RND transporter permease subunit [Acidobacteriota bacterium]|nr:efflux RND transporter permease subunit [Acidobacteriota bacterium]
MWIVRLALRRPYTFVVMSILISVLGGAAILLLPTDIFPTIDIPVVSVIWTYAGISPDEMAQRIVTVNERAMTTVVNDIEHMESQSYNGVAVIKVFFQPTVKVELAVAQITSLGQTITRALPPGIFPPAIVKYNASSVPILQLSINSKTLSEQELYDYGQNFIRTQLATVQGASIPLPYGGKSRQIMVDLDPDALYAKHLSATDISQAINLQNLILPGGSAKVGDREYLVRVNSSPATVAGLNELPVKSVNGTTVYIKDVAQVRDGFAVQTNIVRENGTRAALLTVLKNGSASTLSIVKRIKEQLPRVMAGLPPELSVSTLLDQSLFVRAAITGVVREAIIAAALTGLMILLFLGSWRSTLIVCISIPLSILTSLIVLSLFNETINVMTLGGLALAVGILVDDATVEIENIHRNLTLRKPITRAILDGAQQIAVPAFVSTLAICIVFIPVLLLTGAARYLFTPLAMAVVFAMLASYLLSRTLVPTMVHYLLASEVEIYRQGEEGANAQGWIWRVHHAFNRQFERLRNGYRGALVWTLDHRGLVTALFGSFVVGSCGLTFIVGEDFFPYVDSGQMRLHVRTLQGTRIEETEKVFGQVEDEIRHQIPAAEMETILDNIGLPNGINLAFSDTATIGSGDGEILISLKERKHAPTQQYMRKIREALRVRFPDLTVFFQPANITNQILNFGLPAPIDVQVVGRNAVANYRVIRELQKRIAVIPGAVDVHIHQEVNYPEVRVNVDRTKADQAGLSQRDVANSLLISLSSSGQVAPNQWLNPVNGVNYQVAVQTPQYRIDSFDALNRTPISSPGGSAAGVGSTQLLSNLATMERGSSVAVVNHYNVQPVYDVYVNTDSRDLGGVASDIRKIVKDMTPKLPRGTFIDVRGQVETMNSSFLRLGIGMVFAILLVYLLMVVNFQSWLDPFIILMALPGALAGILWMLFVTQTTLNVPSLMGAIMSIGVATANSILLVSFANDERMTGKNALEAALSAGFTRIRPVTMTALAMIIGMLPMALSLGEGAEQNAPLGRAVIGGLLLATLTTLFFVPVMYTYLRRNQPVDLDRQIEEEQHELEGQDHPV